MDKKEMIKFKGHQLQPMVGEENLVVPHFKGLVKNYRASFPILEPQITKVRSITKFSTALIVKQFSKLRGLSKSRITWKRFLVLILKMNQNRSRRRKNRLQEKDELPPR